jgi:hypothetical protein
MNKDFWGPQIWFSIHYSAAGLKPENIQSFRNFIYSLPNLLPCKVCKTHLATNLQSYPVFNMESNLLYWSWMLHNVVNKSLKKYTPRFKDVESYYLTGVKNPKVWGPPMWRMIHSIAAAYEFSSENAYAFKQFIFSLPGLIPCTNCQSMLLNMLQNVIPLREEYLTDNKKLFLWSYNLHNTVNKKLGVISPNYERVKSFYFNEKCEIC